MLTGMHREMREESLVQPEEIVQDSAVVTGYFRWVDRAMKPEFTGIVRLRCTAGELTARRQRGGERAFTSRTVAVPLQAALDLLAQSPDPGCYRAAGRALGQALMTGEDATPVRTDATGRVLMSPSAEHAWFAAARYLRDHPDWLRAEAG